MFFLSDMSSRYSRYLERLAAHWMMRSRVGRCRHLAGRIGEAWAMSCSKSFSICCANWAERRPASSLPRARERSDAFARSLGGECRSAADGLIVGVEVAQDMGRLQAVGFHEEGVA